jgi:hypothetical protein
VLPPFAGVEDLVDTVQRDTLDRDAAALAVSRASGVIRSHCGWSISREVVTGFVAPMRRASRSLWLPTMWLVSVDALTEDGYVSTAQVDYTYDSTGRVVRAAGYWSPNIGGLVVSYTHGYPDGDTRLETPKHVCLALASRLVGNPYGHVMERTGTEQWQQPADVGTGTNLTPGEVADLGPYVLDML